MGSLYILDRGQKNMSCKAFLMATLGFLGLLRCAWKLHCSGPWRVLLSTSKSTTTVVALGSFSFFFSAEAS